MSNAYDFERPVRRRRLPAEPLEIFESPIFVDPPLLGTGIAYPGGREQNPLTDNADYDSTTDLRSVRDMTAPVQAAHDALAATGLGGTIMLGPGVWRINGVNITAGGIRVVGTGWGEYQGSFGASSPAKRSKLGTYVLTDNPGQSAFVVGPAANNVVISDLAFIQPQPPDAPGWAPTAFAPSINVQGVSSSFGGSVMIERCLFWGVFQGVVIGASGAPAGRITLRDIEFATFTGSIVGIQHGGIHVASCNDVTIDNCNFYPQLLQGSSNQQSYIQSAGGTTAFVIGPVSLCVLTNISAFSACAGLAIVGVYSTFEGPSGPRIKIVNASFESCLNALVSSGIKLVYRVSGLTVVGIASQSLSTALTSNNSASLIDIVDAYITNCGGNAYSLNGSNATLRLGPNHLIDRWDQVAGGNVALKAVASNTVLYSAAVTMFTNSGGGLQTGGGGTFTTY